MSLVGGVPTGTLRHRVFPLRSETGVLMKATRAVLACSLRPGPVLALILAWHWREAASRAQLGLATTDDESVKADSLAVMEEAMSFFYSLALKERRRNGEADHKAIRDN